MKRLLAWLRHRCPHDWENTGLACQVGNGIQVNLYQCRLCGETAILQV